MLLGYENFIVFNSTVAFPLKSQQYDWSIALMFPICVRFMNLSLFSTTVSYLTRLHIFAILSPQTRFLAQFPPKIHKYCLVISTCTWLHLKSFYSFNHGYHQQLCIIGFLFQGSMGDNLATLSRWVPLIHTICIFRFFVGTFLGIVCFGRAIQSNLQHCCLNIMALQDFQLATLLAGFGPFWPD